MQTKVCRKCGTEKSLDDFYNHKGTSDGKTSYCKLCQKAYNKQWKLDNPDKPSVLDNHPNKEREASSQRQARKDYPDLHLKYRRDFNNNHPEASLLSGARRRAKKAKVPCTITKEDIVIPEYCPIFNVRLMRGDKNSCPSLDRIVPELGYVPGNVAVLSMRANVIKNNGTAEEHRLISDWITSHLNKS